MFTVSVFGAGKIGEAICGLLAPTGRYRVRLCDEDVERSKRIAAKWPESAEGFRLSLSDEKSTLELLKGADAVISALPFFCNVQVATTALKAKVHYFDLTEDVSTTDSIFKLANGASTALMPQCGLAPGFISIAASHLIKMFDKVDTVKMRVGALPIYPSNRLKYNLTWSTDGLINEYINLCEMIDEGKKQFAFALEGYERFSLDGVEYEAFNTSGGLGTLCDTMLGKLRRLDYKTIRYPGHRDYIAFLMHDLRFDEDRDTLKKVLERSVSTTSQDKCIAFVEVVGTINGRFMQKTYASTVYNAEIHGKHFGAIQITTAAGVLAPLDLLLSGKIKEKAGFIKSEHIPLTMFLDNEFGKYYRDDRAMSGIAN